MTTYHTPVLLDEVITALSIVPGKKYIDATLGGGGYGWEIVKRGGVLLGIDADRDAIEHTKQELKVKSEKLKIDENWKLVQGNFRNIADIASTHGFDEVDGVVFDLGVSSYQLDTPQKGFSYRFGDAPLDMRFGSEVDRTAADIIKTSSEAELYEIFATYGEEERARAIARAIVRSRQVKPITRAGELAEAVSHAIPENERTETLSRVYQALRIVVNDELGALKDGLEGAHEVLVPGGTLAVVSFHSLEDRIVKRNMDTSAWRVVTRKPVVAGTVEQMRNRRSRSAKLRVAYKL